MALIGVGCSSDNASDDTSAAVPPSMSASIEAAGGSLTDLVSQVTSSGTLQTGITLTYENGSSNFSLDANPEAKEAVISFKPDRTWSAYFASAPSQTFTGTYNVKTVDSEQALAIVIIHDGASADGNDNQILLKPDGMFEEESVGGGRKASGPYAIT